MRVDIDQPFLDLGDTVSVRCRLGLGEKLRALGVGGKHPADQAFVAARRFLCDMPDARTLRGGDAAVVGRGVARNQLQERRLPRAVAADEPDLVPGRDGRGRGFEDELPLDAVGEIVDVQHGAGEVAVRTPVVTCGGEVSLPTLSSRQTRPL